MPLQQLLQGARLDDRLTSSDRIEELYNSNIIDTPREDFFEDIVDSICQTLIVKVALVSFVDMDRQFFKSARGLSPSIESARGSNLDHSICKYVVGAGEVVAVEDTRRDPVLQHNLAVKRWGIGAYLGAPISKNGKVLGAVCAIESHSRKWTQIDITHMRNFAAAVAARMSAGINL